METKEFINFLENEMTTKPNLFLFKENEPKATIEDINNIEKILLGKLPKSFIEFQMKFGGGTFGFTEIFSVCEKSDFYVLSNRNIIEKGFFPVSDDQCGGIYCFKKNNERFEDKIYYLDLSNLEVIVEETEFNFIQIFMKLAFNK